MIRATTCFYCGMPGTVSHLYFTDPPVDLHVHRCETRMYLDPQTGEIDDSRTRQSPGCARIAELVAEVQALRDDKMALIAARDGEEHEDDPY